MKTNDFLSFKYACNWLAKRSIAIAAFTFTLAALMLTLPATSAAQVLTPGLAVNLVDHPLRYAAIETENGRAELVMLVSAQQADLTRIKIGVVANADTDIVWHALADLLVDAFVEFDSGNFLIRIPAIAREYHIAISGQVSVLLNEKAPEQAAQTTAATPSQACATECVKFVDDMTDHKFSRQRCWGTGIGDAKLWISRARGCGNTVTMHPATNTALVYKAPNVVHVVLVTAVSVVYVPPNAMIAAISPKLRATALARHTEDKGVYRVTFSDSNWPGACRRDGEVLYFQSGKIYRKFDSAKKQVTEATSYTLQGFIAVPK